jgi:hypothetical protein
MTQRGPAANTRVRLLNSNSLELSRSARYRLCLDTGLQSKGRDVIRNLKTLGLALVAALALSSVAVSAASAQAFTSDGPSTMTSTETGGAGANTLTAFGLGIECPGSTYTGHKYNVTPHELIPNNVTTATVTPHFKQANHNCRATPGNFPITIDMNGCDFVIHLGETTPAGNKESTYGVTFDIICPASKEITLTIFTTTALHTENKPFCALHIKEQFGLKGAHLRDTGNGHVDATGTVEGLHINKTNLGTDVLLCPNATTTTGKFDTDLTTQAHNSLGEPTPMSISE